MTPTDPAAPPTLFARLLDTTPLRLALYVALCVASVSPIFSAPPRQGGLTLDWQFFEFFDEVARKTILDFHQLPAWNPYFCGGTPMLGNPQTTWLVPTFPLVLLFGTTFGERLTNLAVMIVACEGGYRLLRHLGLRPAAVLLGSVALPLYGRTFGWFTDGQFGLEGTVLAPWVLYGYLRGLERPAYLALGAAFYAWLLAFRGIQPGPQLAMALGLWALLESRRRWLDGASARAVAWPLGAVAILGVLAAGYIGIRMVPVLHTVLAYPRIVKENAFRNLTDVFFEIYAVPPGTRGWGAPGYVYIGVIAYAAFVGSVVFAAPRRRAAIPLAVAIWFMVLTLGEHGVASPYHWLRQLPLYRSLRNPTLYSFTGAVFVVIGASYGLDAFERWAEGLGAAARAEGRRPGRAAAWVRRAVPWLAAAAAVANAGDLVHVGHRLLGERVVFGWSAPPRVAQEFRQTRGNSFDQALWPYLDRGSLACYDETPWPASSELRPDLPAEEYLSDPTAGTVTRVRWSPHRIDLQVRLTRPATLLVNQNHAPGWSSSVGKPYSRGGLVAVDLPAGDHAVTLRMWPPLATVGLLYMLAAVAATVWLVRRDRRQARG